MAQAALAFAPEFGAEPSAAGHALQPAGAPTTAFERSGWDIGRDHARYGLTPPADQMLFGHPVRQGWDAGQPAFRRRTRPATPAVRQWLALRLQAWLRGAAFEDLQVTPNLLRQITVSHCPVTGERLTQHTGHASDGVIEHLNPQAAYAAGNLAMISRRAQAARAGRDAQAALLTAREAEALPADDTLEGLTAAQWLRLAVLISFATPLPHAQAAALPLLMLPPNRVRVLNPVQALQVVLSLPFAGTVELPRLAPIAALVPARARPAFHVFMTTLLARRVAGGHPWDAAAMKAAMLAAWTDPLVQRRWQRLSLELTTAEADAVIHGATRAGLDGTPWRDTSFAQATEGWGLPVPQPVTAVAVGRAVPASRAGLIAVPGVERRASGGSRVRVGVASATVAGKGLGRRAA